MGAADSSVLANHLDLPCASPKDGGVNAAELIKDPDFRDALKSLAIDPKGNAELKSFIAFLTDVATRPITKDLIAKWTRTPETFFDYVLPDRQGPSGNHDLADDQDLPDDGDLPVEHQSSDHEDSPDDHQHSDGPLDGHVTPDDHDPAHSQNAPNAYCLPDGRDPLHHLYCRLASLSHGRLDEVDDITRRVYLVLLYDLKEKFRGRFTSKSELLSAYLLEGTKPSDDHRQSVKDNCSSWSCSGKRYRALTKDPGGDGFLLVPTTIARTMIEDRMPTSGDVRIIERFKKDTRQGVDEWQCHAAASALFTYFDNKREAWLKTCRWVPPCGSPVKSQKRKRTRAPNTTTNRNKRRNFRTKSDIFQITSIPTACDDSSPPHAMLPDHPLLATPKEEFTQNAEPQSIPTTDPRLDADPSQVVVWKGFLWKEGTRGPWFHQQAQDFW